MICNNCGARVSKKLERCPHCNMMIYAGAEQKYLGKLESIKTEMTELSKKPAKTLIYRLSIVSSIVAFVFCLLLIGMVVEQRREATTIERQDREYERELVKRIAWEDEVFPKLDALYEQGDFESILALRDSFFEEDNGGYGIGNWRHSSFIDIYDDYAALLQSAERIQSHDLSEAYYYGEVLYHAMSLWFYYSEEQLKTLIPQREYNTNWGLTETEVELVRSYRQAAYELMTADLNLSQKDIEFLCEQGETNSLVNSCYDFAKERFGEETP